MQVYRGATPKINGNAVEIARENTDGDGNSTYTLSDGTVCSGEFIAVGTERELRLVPLAGGERCRQ